MAHFRCYILAIRFPTFTISATNNVRLHKQKIFNEQLIIAGIKSVHDTSILPSFSPSTSFFSLSGFAISQHFHRFSLWLSLLLLLMFERIARKKKLLFRTCTPSYRNRWRKKSLRAIVLIEFSCRSFVLELHTYTHALINKSSFKVFLFFTVIISSIIINQKPVIFHFIQKPPNRLRACMRIV